MERRTSGRTRARFAQFELDVETGDLRKAGVRVHIAGQPLRILECLLERDGGVVTRAELQRELWSDDTFVDFDRSLNTAVKRLRAVLGDVGDHARFIETLPRRGYRLIVPVTWERHRPGSDDGQGRDEGGEPSSALARDGGAGGTSGGTAWWSPRRTTWAGTAMVLLVVVGVIGWQSTSRPAAHLPRSLAVLPFAVIVAEAGAGGGDQGDDYVAFGMADALVTELTRLGDVRVVSHTATLPYRHTGKPLPDVAQELGVDAIVEGSVLREGDRIQTTVQLVDAREAGHLWAGRYEHGRDRALSGAREVAHAVALEVRARMGDPTTARPAAPPVQVDPRVSQAFLMGRYHIARGNEADFARARDYFSDALALDPRHAPSHAGLADYYVLNDTLPPTDAFRLARQHALEALAIDATLPDAHASLAFVRYYGEWNWTGAEQAFRRALQLDPRHTRARRWYALFLAAMGRFAEASQEAEDVLTIDPTAMANHDVAAAVAFNARRFEEAAAIGTHMVGLDRHDVRGHEHVALASIQLGDGEGALASVERALSISPDYALMRCFRAMSLARLGRADEAARVMDDVTRLSARQHLSPAIVAMAYATTGRVDLALDALERAYETRDPYLVLTHVSPWFDPLRGEARFERVRAALGFPGE